MRLGAGRIVSTGLLGALAAVVWLSLFYGVRPVLDVEFDSTPPRLLTGVYPAEREPVTGRTFAWTSEEATLRLPGLDRRVEWTLALRVRGARVVAAENPELTFMADGLHLGTAPTVTDYTDISVTIPAQPERRGLTLTIRSSATFVPGPADKRALGVTLDRLRLAPSGLVVPPRGAFAGTALASAAIGAAIAALGVTAGTAIAAATVVGAGVSSAIARGFAPFTDFPSVASRAGLVIALALVVGTAMVRLRRPAPLRNTARFAAAFSACALLLKLLVLLHPDMPIGDALFHAHRFQEVLAGHLYFTSVAPGNYLFPYAPGLYVFAAPFAGLVARGNADMALLRIIVTSFDTAVALLLYAAVVRARGDRLAGACAVAVYQLMPLGFGVLAAGNLTNAFAQSMSVVAMMLMIHASLRIEHWRVTALFAVVVTAAFLSHTSTFALLTVACAAIASLFRWRGGPALRSPALAVWVALTAAVLLAVGMYYAHFIDTYRTELGRIGGETVAAAPDAGGRGIAARLASVPRYLYLYFGVPALVLAAWGGRLLGQRSAADRLVLTLGGWTVACAAFLLLGILTPVDMRYYLAAVPAVALAAAFGASGGWARGGRVRAAVVALLGWALVDGVRGWWSTLG